MTTGSGTDAGISPSDSLVLSETLYKILKVEYFYLVKSGQNTYNQKL